MIRIKRIIAVFSFILFLNCNITNIAFAQQYKSLTQGFYKVKDIGLSFNTSYKVKNSSPYNKAIIEVFDGKQQLQEFLRLEPNSAEYYIRPLGYDYILIIVGDAEIEFS